MPPPTPTTTGPEPLPRWDLMSAQFGFASPLDPAIDRHMEETKKRAICFQETYQNKLLLLPHDDDDDDNAETESTCNLFEALVEFEQIAIRRRLVSSFLSLSYDVALDNDTLQKRKGQVKQFQSQVQADHLEWFELDVARLSPERLHQQLERHAELKQRYQAYLDELRRERPHHLEPAVERALTLRQPYSGTRPLASFLDKELCLLRFTIQGETDSSLTLESLLSRLSSSKCEPRVFRHSTMASAERSLASPHFHSAV